MNNLREEAEELREPNHEINNLIYQRWSPRGLGTNMSEEDLMSLFEAASWAPSSYNNQSWRFVYATHEDEEFEDFEGFLGDFNQQWAENGYALIVVVSKTTFNHNDEFSRTHSFDTGAAWQNFALEAADRGLAAHGMEGFDYEKAAEHLDIPEEYEIEMMIAVGSWEGEEDLPENFRVKPNHRKDLDEITCKGSFDF